MKLQLVVQTPGKMEGKSIPITLSEFVIGRDPQCHLRPASALISKRHCALVIKGSSVYVQDFGSTNGTFVNDQRVEGEVEVKDQDRLKVGPLDFRVDIAAPKAATKPTPATLESQGDDEAAAMLLSMGDDVPSSGTVSVDSQGIPTGSTIMQAVTPEMEAAAKEGTGGGDRMKAAKQHQANTSTAAKAILDKYMRRPRG